MKDNKEVISEFNEYVNMTASELEKWLQSEDSNGAGVGKDDGDGDKSVGQESGTKIVEILKANPDKDPDSYTDEHLEHMRKVVAYCKRHLAQEASSNKEKDPEDVKKTKSYISLKNWGHDFLKSESGKSGSGSGGKGDDEDVQMEDSKDDEEKQENGKQNGSKNGQQKKGEDDDTEEKEEDKAQKNGSAQKGKKQNGSKNGQKGDQGDDDEEYQEEDNEDEGDEEDAKEDEEGGKAKKTGEKRKNSEAQNGSNKKRETRSSTRNANKEEGEDEDKQEAEDDESAEQNSKNGDSGEKSSGKGPEKGETVSWNWGNGNPEGKVLDVKEDKATITTKRGNEVSRDGKPEDPAVILDTGKSKAIKSAHELN